MPKTESKKELNTGLWNIGGIYGEPYKVEYSEKLHTPRTSTSHKIVYYDIDSKIYTIKPLYKLLRVLFKESRIPIDSKTVITITGKYGERGYSFTSNDYNNYSMHLSDQYLVSHAKFNCTDISQRLRIQGKYKTPELKSGIMKLNLWTTPNLQKVMLDFYVPFINKIEATIMSCKSWDEIKSLLENILDNGDMNFKDYIKYLDAKKKLKSIKVINKYDREHQALALINYSYSNSDEEIAEWLSEHGLPEYNCINEIANLPIADFVDKFGMYKYDLDDKLHNFTSLEHLKEFITKESIGSKLSKPNSEGFYLSSTTGKKAILKNNELQKELDSYVGTTNNLDIKSNAKEGDRFTRLYISYTDISNPQTVVFTLRVAKIKAIFRALPESTTDYKTKNPFIIDQTSGDVLYSRLKSSFLQNKLPETYYFKGVNNVLYLYNAHNKFAVNILSILCPSSQGSSTVSSDTESTCSEMETPHFSNTKILIYLRKYINTCLVPITNPSERTSLRDLCVSYGKWCKSKKYPSMRTSSDLKIALEKMGIVRHEKQDKQDKCGYNYKLIPNSI